MKRLACLFLVLLSLLASCGAVAETSLRFDTSREIAAYLDEKGLNYAVTQDKDNYDLFTAVYTPATSTELDKISVQVYAYEKSATVIGSNMLHPDTSDMLKLYQNLESMNESVSFVRFVYNTNNNCIYSELDLPYVQDAEFGHMVERYMYITALVMDQNYDGMAVLFQ